MQSLQPSIIFRLQDGRAKDKSLEIQVDGESIGELRLFEELRIPITKGTHVITSNGFWKSRAYPLEIDVTNNEDIEITLEPIDGKKKYQFYVELRIPQNCQFSEANLKSRKLVWDMGREVFVRKIQNSCIYFDMRNLSYLHPLRFEIDIYNHSMKVYANRKQKIVLYESHVDYIDPIEADGNKIENIKKHSFYREDGTLLGHLFREDEKWFISSADLQERLAEICLTNLFGEMFVNQDHYLLSLESQNRILTYKKWSRKNILEFRNIEAPNAEHHEILMLAFITFSALSRDYSFLYNSNAAAKSVFNNQSRFVKPLT